MSVLGSVPCGAAFPSVERLWSENLDDLITADRTFGKQLARKVLYAHMLVGMREMDGRMAIIHKGFIRELALIFGIVAVGALGLVLL